MLSKFKQIDTIMSYIIMSYNQWKFIMPLNLAGFIPQRIPRKHFR